MLYTAAPGGSDVKAVEEPELYDLDETLVYEFQVSTSTSSVKRPPLTWLFCRTDRLSG